MNGNEKKQCGVFFINGEYYISFLNGGLKLSEIVCWFEYNKDNVNYLAFYLKGKSIPVSFICPISGAKFMNRILSFASEPKKIYGIDDVVDNKTSIAQIAISVIVGFCIGLLF